MSGRFEVYVRSAGVVGIANEEIYVANHRWLTCKVPHIGGDIFVLCLRVRAVRCHELHIAIALRYKPLDHALHFIAAYFLMYDGAAIRKRQVVESITAAVRGQRDDKSTIVAARLRTQPMMEQELARESLGKRYGLR
jgi:hypothetical protein